MSQENPHDSSASVSRVFRQSAEINGAAVSFGERSLSREEDDDVIGLGDVGNVEDGLSRRNRSRVRADELSGQDESEHDGVFEGLGVFSPFRVGA